MRWRTDPPPADSPKTVTLAGSPPSVADVVAHPAQRLGLVEQPAVRRAAGHRGEPEGTDAVGHGHDDHAARRERGAVVEREAGAAGHERAARQPDQHRRARRTRRRPDVEVQAVLVHAVDVEARAWSRPAGRAGRRLWRRGRQRRAGRARPRHGLGRLPPQVADRRRGVGDAEVHRARHGRQVTQPDLRPRPRSASVGPCTPPAGTGPTGASRRSVDRHPHPGVLGADPPRPGRAHRGRRAAPRAQAAAGDAAPRHRPSERAVLRHRRGGGHPRGRRSRRLDAHHRHVGAHAAGPGTRSGRHDDRGGAARWPLGDQHGRGHERPRCTRGHRGRQLRPGAAAPRRPAEATGHLRGRGAALPGGGHPLPAAPRGGGHRGRRPGRRRGRGGGHAGPAQPGRHDAGRDGGARGRGRRRRPGRRHLRSRTSSWSTSISATWPGPRPGRCAPEARLLGDRLESPVEVQLVDTSTDRVTTLVYARVVRPTGVDLSR